MRRARVFRPQRKRVFLGCEGESERGYGTLLQRLLERQRQDIHLNVVLLQPGGDPLEIVRLAQRRIAESERRGETPYVVRAVLLDADRCGQAPERDAQVAPIADAVRLRLIWQRPCHEAVLLRHLDGCQHLRPRTSSQAEQKLCQRWREYVKGMPAQRLEKQIGEEAVIRAASVEPELCDFLVAIGFMRLNRNPA
jgi:hypothetical protein